MLNLQPEQDSRLLKLTDKGRSIFPEFGGYKQI